MSHELEAFKWVGRITIVAKPFVTRKAHHFLLAGGISAMGPEL